MKNPKEMAVKDLFDASLEHSLIVGENELLEEVLQRYSYHKQHMDIFVVRGDNMFTGMITIGDILSFISLKMGEASYRESAWDIMRIAKSCIVKDLLKSSSESDYVKPDDDVLKAIWLMRERNIVDLPVIDEKRRLIGHLNLPEMLHQILEKMPSSKACKVRFDV